MSQALRLRNSEKCGFGFRIQGFGFQASALGGVAEDSSFLWVLT